MTHRPRRVHHHLTGAMYAAVFSSFPSSIAPRQDRLHVTGVHGTSAEQEARVASGGIELPWITLDRALALAVRT